MSTSSPQVIIIGASWAGLASARTYLQLNPSAQITILDDDSSLGGVWSRSRIYPGLICDSPRGLFEFTDLSMVDEEHGKPRFGLIDGEEMHEYFNRYASKWDLHRRCRLNARVVKIERKQASPQSIDESEEGQERGWKVILESGEELSCDKLILATGLYSQPSIPPLPGLSTFKKTLLHSKSLGLQHKDLNDPSITSITIIGSQKSSLESIGLCLSLSQKPFINWIVRPSSRGVLIAMNDPKSPVQPAILNTVRTFTGFSPSIFDTESWIYTFLHSGRWTMGSWLVGGFWWLLGTVLIRMLGYDKSQNGAKIKPASWREMFFGLIGVSLLHKGSSASILDAVHSGERVKVFIGDVENITGDAVAVRQTEAAAKTGEGQVERSVELQTDALILATGFQSSFPFFSTEEALRVGLPVKLDEQPAAVEKHWQNLHSDADREVQALLPGLKNIDPEGITTHNAMNAQTPFRLHQQIVSPACLAQKDRTIAFVGFASNGYTALTSELQALWGIAWLEDLHPQTSSAYQPLPQLEKEVARTLAWMRRRWPGKGKYSPEIPIEFQGYFDGLMRDLGVEWRRKRAMGKEGWWGWREWWTSYGLDTYEGVVGEFLEGGKRGV